VGPFAVGSVFASRSLRGLVSRSCRSLQAFWSGRQLDAARVESRDEHRALAGAACPILVVRARTVANARAQLQAVIRPYPGKLLEAIVGCHGR
jgi:hypothetical protein